MPELPEVETVKRELGKVLPGQTIKEVALTHSKLTKPLSKQEFIARVVGKKIKEVRRRAKMIVIDLSDGNHLAIHLKMTGQLIFKPNTKTRGGKLVVGGHPQPGGLDNLPNKFTHAIFKFNDGSTLFFNDMRKFGWIKHLSNEEKEKIIGKYGVEPLSKNFDLTTFKTLLDKYPNRNSKQFLLDQNLIAGLGNIYVDEACFLSGVLPSRKVKDLKPGEIKKLHQNIIGVLKLSISKKGTSAKNYVRSDGTPGGFVPYLNVYGRAGEPCKKCKTPISKIKLAGRGTHFCSKCQK